ncbi:helix-turn-helix domain-containing protein [Salmonella enterica subsp. enterica]|nr:helix-turn-helix domain-containing protein [Salmonella enterica subsp. enterica]
MEKVVCSIILINEPLHVSVNQESLYMVPGEALLIPSRLKEHFLKHNRYKQKTVDITEDVVSRYLYITQQIPSKVCRERLILIKSSPKTHDLLSTLMSALVKDKGMNTSPCLRDMIYFLCLSVFSHDENFPGFLMECIINLSGKIGLLISKDISKNWRLYDVADKFNMSESLIKKKLKEEDTCFSKILLDTRMATAKRLLELTNCNINSISYQCGYQKVSYFIRIFKQYFGTTPGQFNMQEHPAERNK